MKDTVGNFVSFIEKAVILIILVSTITAIIFEILKMIAVIVDTRIMRMTAFSIKLTKFPTESFITN